MNMTELKPCPFCGGERLLEAMQKPVGAGEYFMIKCADCSAEITRTSKRKAVEAWNRRATNDWVSVADRLPDKDGRYVVFEKRSDGVETVDVLYFAKDGRKVDKYDFRDRWKNVWYDYDSEWGHYVSDSVTHWLPKL